MNNTNSKKRHFTVVGGSSNHGLYISSTPSSASRKVVSKLCINNKNKKVVFSIRETTRGSNKKIYGPYIGYMKKLDKPVKLKCCIIQYKPIVKLKKKVSKMKGGTIDEKLQKLVEEESFSNAQKILYLSNTEWNQGKPFLIISLGASPAYTFTALYILLKKTNPQHSIVEIPLSGLSYIKNGFPPNISHEELLGLFDKYVSPFIRDYMPTHNIIVIDHTHTGKSANTFYDLLIGIGFDNKIYYINLIDDITHLSHIKRPKLYHDYKMILNKSLNLISGHKIPRAVPQYYFWQQKEVDYSQISQDAINLRKRVKDYVKEKIFNKRQKNYNNYMRNQRNPHNI